MTKDKPKILNIYKQIGETPLQVIERVRDSDEWYEDKKITYAGRLDPMAEGVLLLLVGDEVHNKERFTELDKEYEFEVLFCFETDSFDILGKVVNKSNKAINLKELQEAIKSFKGIREQEYPPYSSKVVDGKPLFEWAREGKIDGIKIPTREVNVKDIKFIESRYIEKEKLFLEIAQKIDKIKSYDFRQTEVKDIWEKSLKEHKNNEFLIAKIYVKCTSGTYMRSIAKEVGDRLGVATTTYNILRISVGKYTYGDSA